MQRYHVSATGHSFNYLPEYVAVWQGFFAEEGLEVTVTVPSPWDGVLDDIASGKADAVLGGIWVPAMHFGRGVHYVSFAQVSARAPLAIVGREHPAEFDWQAMPGKVVSMKGYGASAGMFAKLVLREHGVDPRDINFVQDLDAALLGRCFAAGMSDYLVTDYLSALGLEAAGSGHVVAPLAIVGGNVPWSVYYAIDMSGEKRLDTQARFARAIGRGMDWILARDAKQYREFLVRTFPRHDPDILVRLANVYRANGMWTTPRVDPAAYARWQDGIAAAHLIDRPIPYGELIDGRPTEVFARA